MDSGLGGSAAEKFASEGGTASRAAPAWIATQPDRRERVAKESAASRAAKIEREHLASRAATGHHFFKLLGVTVRNGKVYKGTGLLGNELGSLAGACAGVLETRRVAPMAGLISGAPPLLGKAFVQCSNGARKQVEIREGMVTPRNVVWAQLRQEIADFNRMADAVG
jgi:hypothetical protein